jgi:23S rRNA pseudouridine2605 synthase
LIPRRLAKVVREATGLSVQRVSQLFDAGAIALQREAPFGPAEIVYPGEVVHVRGEPIGAPRERRCYAMHKPLGITTTTRDPDGFADLAPWLSELARGAFPVGRLDRDTSGLLLLTSDGDLAYALLSPRHHVEKEYVCTLRWRIAADDPRIARLREGVRLGDEPAHAVRIELSGDPGKKLTVVLTEGKHRQVRRMCKRVGLALSGLARVRIGPLLLGALAEGGVRELGPSEIESLWNAAGGREAVVARQLLALAALADRRRRAGTPDRRLEQWLETPALARRGV